MEVGSGAVERVKGKEFGREILFVGEVKNTSGDLSEFEMQVAELVEKVRKLLMDKAKHLADGRKIRLFLDVIDDDEIQAEEMDKAPVETVNNAAAAVIDDEIQTEKIGKYYRLPADYVRSILALPRERRPEDNPFRKGGNLPRLLGVTEEWIEEQAARSDRTFHDFVLFQDKLREEFGRQGYVEVDEEYVANAVKMQEFSDELWKKQDWTDFEFADPNDPAYASWYEHYEPQPAEEVLCSMK